MPTTKPGKKAQIEPLAHSATLGKGEIILEYVHTCPHARFKCLTKATASSSLRPLFRRLYPTSHLRGTKPKDARLRCGSSPAPSPVVAGWGAASPGGQRVVIGSGRPRVPCAGWSVAGPAPGALTVWTRFVRQRQVRYVAGVGWGASSLLL